LTLQYRQLSGILLIAADEEKRRPQDNDADRDIVTEAIERHLPKHQFAVLKVAEESERAILRKLVRERAA
jgi:hypothetical protein